jgi:hypothetical protein
MKKRKPTMHERNDENLDARAVKALQKQATEETAIEHDLEYAFGRPNKRQRELIADLDRLYNSLRGPEQLLDRSNYSRRVPPKPHSQRTQSASQD